LPKKIILLAGPTASGKSKLAIQLAKKINGEIINADSMQIYKEFSVLSSRPSKTETKKIKHYLYGIISVKKYFSAGDWLKEAKKKIDLCIKKKKIPIIAGGTGLYFNTITKGISKIPDIDTKTRTKVRALFIQLGYQKFYEKLLELDPYVKNRILPTDSQRAQRAYEVKLKTKKSLFEWIIKTKSEFLDFNIKKVFIDIPRDELLQKISKRTELMFKENCIAEVRKFNKLTINKSLSVNKLIGVNEINQYLKEMISKDKCKELINIKTRQYAKRQNTWARGHMKNWIKLYSKNFSILLKKTLKATS
jgi:tRNA dimethylallyltransferase